MTLDEFTIGEHFYSVPGMGPRKWLCVDKGTHFVLAIIITPAIENDPGWLNGPPYAVVVVPLDRHDQAVCYKTEAEAAANA